jgi:hypothetical protein
MIVVVVAVLLLLGLVEVHRQAVLLRDLMAVQMVVVEEVGCTGSSRGQVLRTLLSCQ